MFDLCSYMRRNTNFYITEGQKQVLKNTFKKRTFSIEIEVKTVFFKLLFRQCTYKKSCFQDQQLAHDTLGLHASLFISYKLTRNIEGKEDLNNVNLTVPENSLKTTQNVKAFVHMT